MKLVLALCAALLTLAASGFAYSDSTLIRAFDLMAKPTVDSSAIVSVSNLTIEAHDLKLCLDSGTVYFLAPVMLDSTKRYFGAFFEGRGRFQYRPSLHMERNQLARFMGSDSLSRKFDRVLLYFNEPICRLLRDSGRAISIAVSGRTGDAIEEFQHLLTKNEQKSYLFTILDNLAFPRKEPYLLVSAVLEGSDDMLYEFDPTDREEVSLSRSSFRLGFGNVTELVCQYSSSSDDTYESIDGIGTAALTASHYDIDGTITRDGDLIGVSKVNFRSEKSGVQLITIGLSSDLVVDSIRDSSGSMISFLKFKKKAHQDGAVYVVMPRPLDSAETVSLTFYYKGDIAWKDLGYFYVEAGADWYPRIGFRQRATFDMRFRTPADYAFVATGTEQERRKIKDTLFTHYEVTRPAANVSFNFGIMKKYTFGDTTSTPVDLYFDEGQSIGSHMERQVGDDVTGALKLFSHFFGAPPAQRTVASEILSNQSDAFPGFVRLGVSTWIRTDGWGYERMLRSHEVAHQWWGVGVGYRSYRDQWLSEGFSEFCSLMYLQAVAGNRQFNDRIEEFRKDLVGAKGTKIGDDLEGPPIALGYRASRLSEMEVGTVNLYRKGAYVLHMLRNLMLDLRTMNEDRFLAMMKDYRAIYQDSDATTRGFQRVVEKHIGEDMNWFFDEWIYHNYVPTYDFKYEPVATDSTGRKIMLHIAQRDVPVGFKMYVPVEVQFDDGKAYFRVLVDGPQIDIPVELPKRPERLVLNPFHSVLARVNQ